VIIRTKKRKRTVSRRISFILSWLQIWSTCERKLSLNVVEWIFATKNTLLGSCSATRLKVIMRECQIKTTYGTSKTRNWSSFPYLSSNSPVTQVESCEKCNAEAEGPFDWVIRALPDAKDYVDYILGSVQIVDLRSTRRRWCSRSATPMRQTGFDIYSANVQAGNSVCGISHIRRR